MQKFKRVISGFVLAVTVFSISIPAIPVTAACSHNYVCTYPHVAGGSAIIMKHTEKCTRCGATRNCTVKDPIF